MGTHPIFESDFDCLTESKILIFGMSQTFFKRVEHKFTDVSLDDGVELLPFLDACRDYLEFYDLFGGTVFAPIKSDVNGNVGKLQGWYEKDKTKTTLEALLQVEIEAKSTLASGSATDALLWLKRGLWMMAKFMRSMLNGERDANKSFNESYTTTLKPHHNFIVKNLFVVGLKMIPDFKGFIDIMAGPGYEGDKEKDVLADMEVYIAGMEKILEKVDAFYVANKLKHP